MSQDRDISVEIPAIEDEIFFARLEGDEAISTPFHYSLLISCKEMDIDPLKVLGTKALVTLKAAGDGSVRHFHGMIADFALDEIRDDLAFFRMTLRPWLWFLSLDTDNRIFQEMTTPDIVEQILGDWPEAKYKLNLRGKYEKRHYCVQYGESDLNFIQRLFEDEGIFYWFDHADDGHTMMIADANEAFEPGTDSEEVPYEPDSRVSFRDGAFITHWVPKARVRSGKFAQTDYDFEKPSFDLMTIQEAPIGHEQDKAEVYHYPGRYTDLNPGQKMSEVRLQELQADQQRVEARGTARQLGAGKAFTLTLFPRDSDNQKYIVVAAHHEMWDEELRAGQSREGTGYLNRLELSPVSVTYRPPRRSRKPRMQGPQTAIVTGPSGAEIFTDEYSRVKVQFYWDRLGGHDENTTCFIRVSAAWAGAGWGFIQIPRIGHEVIVDFLEGDPDQPIITGRVYNAEQTVPYGLPGNASQSGWKSWSTPGGGGWNELRFEDKAGDEEVYFQAQKNHVELIKNDETRTIGHDFAEDVGHDAQQSIGHDRTESVGHDKTVTVGNNQSTSIGVNDDEIVGSNRTLTVGANETISIGANSTETIGANHTQTVAIAQTITVGALRTDTVGAAEIRSVGAIQENTIGLSRSVSVGTSQTHSIGSDDGWTVGGAQSVSVGKDQSVSVAGAMVVKVGKGQSTKVTEDQQVNVGKKGLYEFGQELTIASGKTVTIEGKDQITLKSGKAEIVLKKDGTISIKGKDITLDGSGKINVKASSDVIVKGSTIKNN